MSLRSGLGMLFTLATVLAVSTPLTGCSDNDDDGGTAPDLITVADLEGTWVASSYIVTSRADAAVFLDTIALGTQFTMVGDGEGGFTGTMELPEALGGPMTVPFGGTVVLEDQQTLTVNFDPEIPPLLTSFTGPFSLEEDTLTLNDEDAVFDFMDGNGLVPATATAVLDRR